MGRESRKRTSDEYFRDDEPGSKAPRTVNNLLKQVRSFERKQTVTF